MRIDRFVLSKEWNTQRVTKGWRIERYSMGSIVMQHLRTGRAFVGVTDCFGDIVRPENDIHPWFMETEEIVPFYK